MKSLTKRRHLIRIAIIVLGLEVAAAFTCIGIYKHFVPHPPGLSNEQTYHYGHDFIVYYAAARMTLNGLSDGAYDLDALHQEQKKALDRDVPFAPWVYPPTFLLIVLPFGLLPYVAAYAAWCVTNIGACVLAGWSVLNRWWGSLLVVLFPATWLNIFAGQNGGLTAGLMLGGLGLLHKHPVPAGILFGLMSYKPQFGLLLPLALAVGRHWCAFVTASASVFCFAVLSYLSFGADSWTMFLSQMRSSWTTQSEILWWKSVTMYPFFRLLGLSTAAAAALQAVSTLLAVGLVIYSWRRPRNDELRAASLAFGTLLATPRAMMYDLTLLLVPFCFLLPRVRSSSSLQDWTFLALLWLCPMIGFFIFESIEFQFWGVALWTALLFGMLRYSKRFPADIRAAISSAQ
jgi:hypothetical protein